MNYVLIFLVALLGGVIGAMLLDWRFWLSFLGEVRRHGFDNHPCRTVGCCR
jgi:hypothetical protein